MNDVRACVEEGDHEGEDLAAFCLQGPRVNERMIHWTNGNVGVCAVLELLYVCQDGYIAMVKIHTLGSVTPFVCTRITRCANFRAASLTPAGIGTGLGLPSMSARMVCLALVMTSHTALLARVVHLRQT